MVFKKTGRKYRKCPALPKSKVAWPSPEQVVKLLPMFDTVMKGLKDNDKQIIFVDQFKCPLRQSPRAYWAFKDDDVQADIRLDNITLTVCVACSNEKYLGFQVFLQEMKSEDKVYFIYKLLKSRESDKSVRILLDNAPWHASSKVKESLIYPYLIFNLPRLPQYNMIENTFSSLRQLYRRRPVKESLTDELLSIIKCMERVNEQNWNKYVRNWLRIVIKTVDVI